MPHTTTSTTNNNLASSGPADTCSSRGAGTNSGTITTASASANPFFAIDPALLQQSVSTGNGIATTAQAAPPAIANIPNAPSVAPPAPSASAGPASGAQRPRTANANPAPAGPATSSANSTQIDVDDLDMVNVSMFRAIRPADMVRPPRNLIYRPYFVVSAALFLGLMNAEEVDRVRISTSREFRCHRFPNWHEAFGFYRAFYIAGILRHSPATDDAEVLAIYDGMPLDRTGLAPIRDPFLQHASALASLTSSLPFPPREPLGPLCARCGAAISRQQSTSGVDAGSAGNPIFVSSAAPTPDLSARTTRVTFAAPPPAPPRAPAPSRDERQASPTPLPRGYRPIRPRPFPMPPPAEEQVEMTEDAPQPRKKPRTAAAKADKGKGKEKAKASSDEDVPVLSAAFQGGVSPFLALPTSGSVNNTSTRMDRREASMASSVLKRKAGPSNTEGSAAPKASRPRAVEQDFLHFINSAKRKELAELAFQKMGNKPGDPDVHAPPSTSGSSSSSSASASSSSTPSSSSGTAIPNSNAPTLDLTVDPSTSGEPAPIIPDAPGHPSRPAMLGALLDAVAALAGHASNAAPPSPSETDMSGLDREELERMCERYD